MRALQLLLLPWFIRLDTFLRAAAQSHAPQRMLMNKLAILMDELLLLLQNDWGGDLRMMLRGQQTQHHCGVNK